MCAMTLPSRTANKMRSPACTTGETVVFEGAKQPHASARSLHSATANTATNAIRVMEIESARPASPEDPSRSVAHPARSGTVGSGRQLNVSRLSPFLIVLCLVACGPTDTAKLYKASPKAPTFDAASIEALNHLGPTVIDQGVNFGVYSERAERIELLLFDNPESPLPTRQFPLERFGNVWNIHIQGI